ncbi:hypothetical protein GWI33_014436 [Rhynchophorus ferrugineus]|uniref:SCP domain-containing protein n=1 Tax=Rhynchophorus ferrugineus TaxID=354439 RepID=A0A834I1N3_RHYFE|nr:hypothetical protein GWI33_014436 [Rhynchophorus ferrugineus]
MREYLLILVVVTAVQGNSYCDLSCRIGKESFQHTKCGPGLDCGSNFVEIGLTDDDRQYILDIHNYLRNKVALGYERRGRQPPVANMRVMNYDRELEFTAQCWINSCQWSPLRHDKCRGTALYNYVGQNLAYFGSTNPKIDKVKLTRNMILSWYDEVILFNNSWVYKTKNRGSRYPVGHYTQIVWANSAFIGCGMNYFTTNSSGIMWHHVMFGCNYAPGGNYLGASLYKVGKAATKCAENSTKNRQYRGLCGQSQRVKTSTNFTSSL